MAKITLANILSGFNLTKINDNFNKIADTLNNQVLYRDNPGGEANQLNTDLDANNRHILNLAAPITDNEPARLKDVKAAIAGQAGLKANLINFEPTPTVLSNNVQGAIEEIVRYTPPTQLSGMGVTTVAKRLGLEPIAAEEFNAIAAAGSTLDAGPAISAAIVACRNAGRLLVFNKTYVVSTVQIIDATYSLALHSNNAQFTGIATTPTTGIFEIVNCVDFHMTGNWRIHGNNNNNYDAGLYIRAQTGTAQATTRVNIYNPTLRNCKVGIAVGVASIDYQCSEINVFGANFFACPIAIYNGGSNTGAQYIGCNLVSEHNAAFSSSEQAIWMEGGFVKVVGGSIVTNPSASRAILLNPCSGTMYGNVYPSLVVSGAHVESNSQLLALANSKGLSSPISNTSNVTFVGCTGYSGATAGADFIFIGDATYEGVLDVRNNNWYSSVVRTGYNISCASTLVKIITDKVSFGRNFKNWIGGIFNGIVLHEMLPVMHARGLSATYTAGTSNTLKFLTNTTTNELTRYGSNYNPATGEFTVPAGGFTRAEVQCGIAGGTAVLGDFYLKRGTAIAAFGTFNGVGTLNTTLYNLVAGEKISVVFAPQTNNYTTDSNEYNFFNISAAT